MNEVHFVGKEKEKKTAARKEKNVRRAAVLANHKQRKRKRETYWPGLGG
jgi:hypothetical protein